MPVSITLISALFWRFLPLIVKVPPFGMALMAFCKRLRIIILKSASLPVKINLSSICLPTAVLFLFNCEGLISPASPKLEKASTILSINFDLYNDALKKMGVDS